MGCGLGEVPKELDLSIEEPPASFSGLGPDCAGGVRSTMPNSDVVGVLLSDDLAFNIREVGVVGVVG